MMKHDAWKTILSYGEGNFSGAFAVKLQGGIFYLTLRIDCSARLQRQNQLVSPNSGNFIHESDEI